MAFHGITFRCHRSTIGCFRSCWHLGLYQLAIWNHPRPPNSSVRLNNCPWQGHPRTAWKHYSTQCVQDFCSILRSSHLPTNHLFVMLVFVVQKWGQTKKTPIQENQLEHDCVNGGSKWNDKKIPNQHATKCPKHAKVATALPPSVVAELRLKLHVLGLANGVPEQ